MKISCWMTLVDKQYSVESKVNKETNSWLSQLFVSVGMFIVLVTLSACSREINTLSISGPIMGTEYRFTLVCNSDRSEQAWQDELVAVMETVNQSMSTWQKDSELSQFNQNKSTEFEFASQDLLNVLAISQQISLETNGAFDVTVMPLVNLWGFGPGSNKSDIEDRVSPSEEALTTIQDIVGYKKLQFSIEEAHWKKNHPDVSVDFSAVAKGYAVDKVSKHLLSLGCENHLVDIGGEVRVQGHNSEGNDWRIAIEKPDTVNNFQTVIDVTNMSIASSGDYRNFYFIDGKRYSHTIDPRTLKPIEHNLASVTVLDSEAAKADALATAFMVMGDEALNFAEENGVPAFFIFRNMKENELQEGSKFKVSYSTAFEQYFVEKPK